MIEIRTTLDWKEEPDKEIITGVLAQYDIRILSTPVGKWITKSDVIIGFISADTRYYFKPVVESQRNRGIVPSESPPTRAQRTPGLLWKKMSTGEIREWNGREWQLVSSHL